LKSKPDIGYSSISYQLEQLIVIPLRNVGNMFPPCVVVLDALDECKDSGTTSIILSSLSQYITELSPIRFLVTSRPDTHIIDAFRSQQLSSATQRLILHEVQLDVVEVTSRSTSPSSLSRIREDYELDETWPSLRDVDSLVEKSSGLFIFAATSVNFIEDRECDDPEDQLTYLLCTAAPTEEEKSSPYHILDRLYTQVLDHAYPDIRPNFLSNSKWF